MTFKLKVIAKTRITINGKIAFSGRQTMEFSRNPAGLMAVGHEF